MAAYREHLIASGLVGAGVGAAAVFGFGFTAAQGALAAALCCIAGTLPDLDSSSGKPIRELFSLLAAISPMLLMERLVGWTRSFDEAVLAALLIYGLVRYGGASLLARVSVHRGMFHSLPAAAIAAGCTFLFYKGESLEPKVLMAIAVAAGYLSHLVLDEIYAVEWSGAKLELNQFAGSAVKLFSSRLVPTLVSYCLLAAVAYMVMLELKWLEPLPIEQMAGMLKRPF